MARSRSNLDPRDMKAAYVVSDDNGYYDSQNIISVLDPQVASRVLSCVLHHSRNHEGGRGLTLSSTRSLDGGRSWSRLVPIEEPETEEDCRYYGVSREGGARQSHDGYQLLLGERILLFYGWNQGSHPPQAPLLSRTDMQLDEGFWMRWSDDYGRSFIGGRVVIPVRRTDIDRMNPWQGCTIGAFCCDKPQVIDGRVFFAFQKTQDGNGESYGSEVFLMRSTNLVSLAKEGRMAEATWETLPKGERGLQTRRGLLLGEEPHVLQISGPRLLCFWRTELGFLDTQYSDDYGETWSSKALLPLTYTLGREGVKGDKREEGSNAELQRNSLQYLASEEYQRVVVQDHSVIRNPRGAITPHVTRDGHIALLFYNNGHTERVGYTGRLLIWLILGSVQGGGIVWSQPEVVLWWDGVQLGDREDWNEDWAIVDGAGYHDIQELPDGKLAFVESNKLTVRYQEISTSLLDGLRAQLRSCMERPDLSDLVLCREDSGVFCAPVLPDLRAGGGFSLVCWLDTQQIQEGEGRRSLVRGLSTVSGALDEEAAKDVTKGYEIFLSEENVLELTVTDGFSCKFSFSLFSLTSEVCQDMQEWYGTSGHVMVAFILDGGPKIASCVINEKLYNVAPCGWKFLPREFGEIGGSEVEVVEQCGVARLMVIERAITTSQAVQLYRHYAQ